MGFQGRPDQPYYPPPSSGGSNAFGAGFSGCLGVGCAIAVVIALMLILLVACVAALG